MDSPTVPTPDPQQGHSDRVEQVLDDLRARLAAALEPYIYSATELVGVVEVTITVPEDVCLGELDEDGYCPTCYPRPTS